LASDALLFYAFAAVTVLGALAVVVQKNPVYSLVSLVGAFFGLSGLYVLLDAPFLAVVQIIVYAGAIMVLFLFVVMVLNVPREDAAEWDRAHPLYRPMAVRVGAGLALLLALELGWALSRTTGLSIGVADEHPGVSSVAELGRVLFTDYMFAFEVTSILIIAAMIGAVVLARKRED
jgi:NADH-quinone oxidoreductase subunit J